ncbi:MAG: AAA family ATPase [Bacteroidales bacterium]
MAQEFKNAIDYIKENQFFNIDRFNWVVPLINKVLTDSLSEIDIENVIESKGGVESQREQIEEEIFDPQKSSISSETSRDSGVKKISSITKIHNIGLLEVPEPIKLKDGLNIFYGKNAGGKSSVFSALCKVLGTEKKIIHNINSTNHISFCGVKIINTLGNEEDITWKSNDINEKRNVKIFDNQISNYILENDQVNQFELARLKSEYFSFLHTMLDKISDGLQKRHDNLELIKTQQKTLIENNFQHFFQDEEGFTKEQFDTLSFTDNEKKRIIEIEGELNVLGKTDNQAIIKNLETALLHIRNILELFGNEKDVNIDGESVIEWSLKYSKESIKEINDKISSFKNAKDAFSLSKGQLTKLVPEGWISQKLWDNFIECGIRFIKSLDETERSVYIDNKCAFCMQPLSACAAKDLMRIYNEILEKPLKMTT